MLTKLTSPFSSPKLSSAAPRSTSAASARAGNSGPGNKFVGFFRLGKRGRRNKFVGFFKFETNLQLELIIVSFLRFWIWIVKSRVKFYFNFRCSKQGEEIVDWHDVRDDESFLSVDSDYDPNRAKFPSGFPNATPKLCIPCKSWQETGSWMVPNVRMHTFFDHFFGGKSYSCAPHDTVESCSPWECGHRTLTIATPESGIVYQDQYLWREHHDLEIRKVSLCEGNNAFENDFRILEKWTLRQRADGVHVSVFTGVHWLNSWSMAKVEEKFPKENFLVNREMRNEISVYESIL
jgi:hypothetical protein